MSQDKPFRFFPDAYRGRQFKPTIILLSSLLLTLVWWYFGRFRFYDAHLAVRLDRWFDARTMRAVYTYVNCFLLLGVVPAGIVKLVFREKLSDYGVQLGDWRRWLPAFLLLAPLFVAAAYAGSRMPKLVDYYPVDRGAGDCYAAFGLHAATYLLLYMAFEFHYRGYVQFGLRDSLGPINALLVQVTTWTLIHLDVAKPANETFGAIMCGFLWGIIAFRTRSILCGLLLHFLLGISLDLFITWEKLH